MRWLVHGNITPAAIEALGRHEQQVQTAQEAGLTSDASPAEVFKTARKLQLELITTDANLADAPYEPETEFTAAHDRVIVYLQLEGGDIEQHDAIDRLFERYKRLSPGRLYTVTGARVKVRQLPGPH
jgi:hypothetical protein